MCIYSSTIECYTIIIYTFKLEKKGLFLEITQNRKGEYEAETRKA